MRAFKHGKRQRYRRSSTSLDKDLQAQLAASFEKAVGVDTPSDVYPFHRQTASPHGHKLKEYRLQKAETALDKKLFTPLGQKRANRKEKAIF
jgi:hypothetical protein